jgi:hypothetical protein
MSDYDDDDFEDFEEPFTADLLKNIKQSVISETEKIKQQPSAAAAAAAAAGAGAAAAKPSGARVHKHPNRPEMERFTEVASTEFTLYPQSEYSMFLQLHGVKVISRGTDPKRSEEVMSTQTDMEIANMNQKTTQCPELSMTPYQPSNDENLLNFLQNKLPLMEAYLSETGEWKDYLKLSQGEFRMAIDDYILFDLSLQPGLQATPAESMNFGKSLIYNARNHQIHVSTESETTFTITDDSYVVSGGVNGCLTMWKTSETFPSYTTGILTVIDQPPHSSPIVKCEYISWRRQIIAIDVDGNLSYWHTNQDKLVLDEIVKKNQIIACTHLCYFKNQLYIACNTGLFVDDRSMGNDSLVSMMKTDAKYLYIGFYDGRLLVIKDALNKMLFHFNQTPIDAGLANHSTIACITCNHQISFVSMGCDQQIYEDIPCLGDTSDHCWIDSDNNVMRRLKNYEILNIPMTKYPLVEKLHWLQKDLSELI